MPGNFESLNLEISVSAQGAATQVAALTRSLRSLNNALKDLDKSVITKAFPKIARQAEQAANAVSRATGRISQAVDKGGSSAALPQNFWGGTTVQIEDVADKAVLMAQSMRDAFGNIQTPPAFREWAQAMSDAVGGQNLGASFGETIVAGLKGSKMTVVDVADDVGRVAGESLRGAFEQEVYEAFTAGNIAPTSPQVFFSPEYAAALEQIGQSASSAGMSLQGFGSSIADSFGEAIKQTKEYAQVSSVLDKVTKSLAPAVKAAGKSVEEFGEMMETAAVPITAIVIAIELAVKAATFFVDQFNEFNAAMKKVVDTAKALNEKYNPFVSLKKELESLLALAKRQIMRRAINAVIKSITDGFRSGIENLAQYDEQFSATIGSFRNALGLFKNSISVAVAPIISYFIPAINALLSALTKAMNTLARLTALLTGQHTYTIAKDYQEIGESAGGANSKVKELQRTILGFDEINRLNGQNGSGSGGGGGASDAISAYETLNVGEWPYDSWGEALLDFVKWLDGVGVPKLRAGLDKVSKFVNEFSRNLFDALTFDGVQDAISNLATHIGETLNNFLTGGEGKGGLNWADMGKAIGMVIQTAFNFAANFLRELDFFALGQSLAEFINNAIKQINPKDVADVLFTPIRAAFGLIVGFLVDFDFPEFAQKAGAVVNNMIASLTKLIGAGTGDKHGGKWQSYFQIAVTNIANGIVALFDTIDWVSLFDTLTTIVSSIIDGLELILNKLMQNKEFVNAVHRFVDFIINTAVRWFILKIKAVTGLAGNMSIGRLLGAALLGGGESDIDGLTLNGFGIQNVFGAFVSSAEEATEATEDFSQAANIAALTTKASMHTIDTASTQMAQQVDISGHNVVNAFRTMTTDSNKPLSDLSKNVNTNFTSAKNSITSNMTAAKNGANSEAQALQNYLNARFRDAASTANTQFAGMRDNIKSRITEAKSGLPAFNDVGANIKNGIIGGMGDFKGQLNTWCNQFKDQILKNFRIKSPSRWARDMVGENLGEGIAVGLEQSGYAIKNVCADIQEGIAGEFDGSSFFGAVRSSAGRTGGSVDLASAIGAQVSSAMLSAQNGNDQRPIVCEVYLDRDRIATAVTRGQQAQNRRYSSTALA